MVRLDATLKQMQSTQGDVGLTSEQRNRQAAGRDAGRTQRPSLSEQKDIAAMTSNSARGNGSSYINR